MPAKTGAEYLESLKDGRAVYVGDDVVSDVTEHPALKGAALEIAAIYDLQHEFSDDCLFPDPETGEMIGISHIIPKSKEEILHRHRGLKRVADYAAGIMGRTPDYKNTTYAAFAGAAHKEWAPDGNEAGAERLIEYQKFMRRNDVLLTHTLINPTIDKSCGDFPVGAPDVALHKVEDTEHGIIVSGARILATLAPFANELAVYPGVPLAPDRQKNALAFSVPMNTPGLHFLCRDSYAAPNLNHFDHPLSSRFDEQDAFVIFDRVEVPRERVFIDGSVPVYNSVMSETMLGTVCHQTLIRASTKLEFAWALATAMTESIGDKAPPTKQLLGELWSYVSVAQSVVNDCVENSYEADTGVWVCETGPLKALQPLMTVWMPRVMDIFKSLGAHNLLATPTQAMLNNPDISPMVNKYLRGANSVEAEQRSQLFRIAWDFCGSSLAGRCDLYERFYFGSTPRARMIAQAHGEKTQRKHAERLLQRFL